MSDSVSAAAQSVIADRPLGQIASIAAQLEELFAAARAGDVRLENDRPIGIGISGGRLRIAFMHPDMGRFYGPAWQMPIGAADQSGREQIVVLMQTAHDNRIRLYPTNPEFREHVDWIDADSDCMFPGEEIDNSYAYESFGTRMAQNVLSKLGYVSDEEIRRCRQQGIDLPEPSKWISNGMRRPFSLLINAIASMRTLRTGRIGERVESALGAKHFRGLRVLSTGDIPQGGFSSSSAVTVAVKNAMNALFHFGLGPDQLVQLACQAEYGTGVRAGALDQATEQKGRAAEGVLISSNPRENYRVIRTYAVPSKRFRVLFPYSVDRDQAAWKWSAGTYAESANTPRLTTEEMRKMTGKAAEIAAVLLRLPLDVDFFQEIEADLVEHGELTPSTTNHVRDRLKQIPLLVTQDELRQRLPDHRDWYADQLVKHREMDVESAREMTHKTFHSFLEGWRDPTLLRSTTAGETIEEVGAPLRGMVAYLYGEVAKNCYLIHHCEQWIDYVSRSQQGDRCFDIDSRSLPSKQEMLRQNGWEQGLTGELLMQRWLQRCGAKPIDFNRGLDDQSLSGEAPWHLHRIEGGNFFRGLALIDLFEAMLKRAFGENAIAVRVNGAGQGDYFQVHVDTQVADLEDVKKFIRVAFYRRFDISRRQDFVEPHPGGGAVGVQLDQFDQLPQLVKALRHHVKHASTPKDVGSSELPTPDDASETQNAFLS